MRVELGRVDQISDSTCVSVGEGRAVVVRVGSNVRAFANRCLHQDSPLAGGWVRDGVLTCPLHFWRYQADTGSQIGSDLGLPTFPVEIVEGCAFVELPDEQPRLSMRDQLLARARTYDRGSAFLESRFSVETHISDV